MRKVLRYAAHVLLICLSLILASLVLIPVGLLLLFGTWQLIKIERFYAERPILHAMRWAHDGRWSNDSERAQSVLLQRGLHPKI